jgi:hypothetical protein
MLTYGVQNTIPVIYLIGVLYPNLVRMKVEAIVQNAVKTSF